MKRSGGSGQARTANGVLVSRAIGKPAASTGSQASTGRLASPAIGAGGVMRPPSRRGGLGGGNHGEARVARGPRGVVYPAIPDDLPAPDAPDHFVKPSDCADTCAIVGSDRECTAPLKGPIVSMDEIQQIAADALDGNFYDFESDILDLTVHPKELIAFAWAMVVANLDLIDWAMCLLTGRKGSGDCLRRHFEGKSRISILAQREFGTNRGYCVIGESNFEMWAPYPFTKIHVCLSNPKFVRLMSDWEEVRVPFDSRPAVCVLTIVAAALVHEMGHICGRTDLDSRHDPDPDQVPRPCDTVRRLEHMMRWALNRRYSDPIICPEADSVFCAIN